MNLKNKIFINNFKKRKKIINKHYFKNKMKLKNVISR